MAKVKITGHASGSGVFTITAPNSNTDRTITLPDASVTLGTDATKLPLAGGALTGAVTTNSTFDGVDIATRDGVLTSTTATATAALPKAGGTMTGHLLLGDNDYIQVGNSQDLKIFHDSSNSYINDTGTGDLIISGSNNVRIKSAGGEDMIIANADNAVTLYHNNAAKLATTATGVAVTGGVAIGGTGTANTLDDYEEGTWTPALASNTTSCSMGSVYTSHYTKIGNVVKLYTSFDIDSSANPATGVLRFTGFPFALKTLGEGSFLISLYYNYKVAPMVFMSKGGYTYYTNTTVNGNNLRNLTETIGQSTTNVMGMQFSYLTDA